jgi:hypothetical protein
MAQWHDNEVWQQIDALAASYEQVNGVRPTRLVLGEAVAREIEGPQEDGHPPHLRWESPTSGVWFPSPPPVRPYELFWRRWAREHACKRQGGHWWHPADPMIEWFCCRCGKSRDGMPKDGT